MTILVLPCQAYTIFMGIALQCGRPPVAVASVPCADTQWMLWMKLLILSHQDPQETGPHEPSNPTGSHLSPASLGDPYSTTQDYRTGPRDYRNGSSATGQQDP